MAIDPPIFEDRRRLPDRRRQRTEPVGERQVPVLRTALAAGIAIAGGLVLVYVFFATVAEVDVTEAAVVTAVVALLAAAWIVAYWIRARRAHPRGPESFERERRGF